MREGERLPHDQAEVTFSTQIEDWVANNVERARWDEVLDDIVALFTQPWGKHPLSNRGTSQLAGLNTTATLRNEYRIVYQVSVSPEGTGVIEILAIGPRSNNRIYDAASALISSGKLSAEEAQSVWDMLTLYETTAEKHGLELWDCQPDPAPPGLIKSAVAIEALPQEVAELLAADEINAAMANAWDPDTGELDPARAMRAALSRVAGSANPERIITLREKPRCGAPLPRAGKPCIRRGGHPGAHRATP